MVTIVDFDNTLIIENSSEIFERALLKKLTPFPSFVFNILLFSKFRIFTDIFVSTLSKVFFDRKDLRLYLFLKYFIKKEGNFSYELLTNRSLSLTKNENLIKMFADKHFYIASCGLEPFIESFIEDNKLDAELLISSNIINSKPLRGLISINDKIESISSINKFTYITDSSKEVRRLKKIYKSGCKISQLNVGVSHRKLFEVMVY